MVFRCRLSWLVLGFCFISHAATAQSVSLKQDWSDQRWLGYPESVGQVQAHWEGDTLQVVSVVDWASGTDIDPSSARVTIKDNHIMLICYKNVIFHEDNGQPALSASAPVILRFSVTHVPRQNYDVTVSDDCGK